MNDPRDLDFHDEELSALYRETRDAEPPAWLDRRVLTAARAAVEPHARSATPLRQRRGARFWAVPVALAATVIMAVGIVRLARETGELRMPPEMKAVQSLAKPAAEQDAVPADEAAPQATGRALPRTEPPAAPQPSPPVTGAIQTAPPVPAIPSELSPVKAMPAKREKLDRLQATPAHMEEGEAVRDRAVERPPAEWLAEIDELRRQGRTAEAEASLREFQRRYPDYPLDAGLAVPR